MPKKQRKYATTTHPTIEAILGSHYRFASEAQAQERMEQLRSHFVTKKQVDVAPDALVMWIRGFEVTPEEAEKGYTGNFCRIAPKLVREKYTLVAEKMPLALASHPQRKRPPQKHPDWGHPILRDIKKKRMFFTLDDAEHELERLHEEFPLVSIPGPAKLMLIVYEKIEGVKSPVQKYKFEVKTIPEGGFFIDFKRNSKPVVRAKKVPPAIGVPKPEPAEGDGYFATMVHLKRKKKTRPSA